MTCVICVLDKKIQRYTSLNPGKSKEHCKQPEREDKWRIIFLILWSKFKCYNSFDFLFSDSKVLSHRKWSINIALMMKLRSRNEIFRLGLAKVLAFPQRSKPQTLNILQKITQVKLNLKVVWNRFNCKHQIDGIVL